MSISSPLSARGAHRKMPSFLIGFFSIPMGSVLNGKTPIPEEIGKLHVQLFIPSLEIINERGRKYLS